MLGLLLLGACGARSAVGARQTPIIPTVQYRTNSEYAPGYVNPCAGGQAQMQYNCGGLHN